MHPSVLFQISKYDSIGIENTHRPRHRFHHECTHGIRSDSLELGLELLGKSGDVFGDRLARMHTAVGVALGDVGYILRQYLFIQGSTANVVTD